MRKLILLVVLIIGLLSSCTIPEGEREFNGDINKLDYALVSQLNDTIPVQYFDYEDKLIVAEYGEIVKSVEYVDEGTTAFVYFLLGALGLFLIIGILTSLD